MHLILKIVTSVFLLGINAFAFAGDYPKELKAYCGTTPKLDGIISEGEYADATQFFGTSDWIRECGFSDDTLDLSLKAWVKHDGKNLYFAFDVTDNVIFGIDIPRWLPDNNSTINDFSLSSSPWFGDGVELFLNPENKWEVEKDIHIKGNGLCWSMQASSHKSFQYKLQKGGLLQANPRTREVWDLYQDWITSGAQQAIVRIKNGMEGKGYVVEWKIKADPCLEVSNGKYWTPELGVVRMGLNIELQDLDKKEQGRCSFAHYRHIDVWAAEQGEKSNVNKWGTLILIPDKRQNNE